MSLNLYFHPLSSFCQKALIALYENNTPFVPHIVNLQDDASSAYLTKIWPIKKFPVMRDEARDRTVPEATIIIEYLDLHYRGPTRFVPENADLAWQVRLADRFYDLYVNEPMQKIIGDRRRPDGKHDPHGVGEARARLQTAYGIIERDMATRPWAAGDAFSMADCAASPALFYANMVAPFGSHQNVAAYFRRLAQRPAFARVLKEAEPYLAMVPK